MIIKPKEFLSEHWYLDSGSGIKPEDFVKMFYMRSGIFLGEIFSLRRCHDAACCNPTHFRIGITRAPKGEVRTKMVNLLDLADEIDWGDCFAQGFQNYLKYYNMSQERDCYKISENDLIQAFLLKGLSLDSCDRYFRMNFRRIFDNKKLQKLLYEKIDEILAEKQPQDL